jgi:hypothetical protein
MNKKKKFLFKQISSFLKETAIFAIVAQIQRLQSIKRNVRTKYQSSPKFPHFSIQAICLSIRQLKDQEPLSL